MKRAAPVKIETNAEVVAKARSEGRIGAGTTLAHPLEQDDFEAEAIAVAEAIGYGGEPEWEIEGMAVRDARVYLRKCLHEIHVEAFGGPQATTHEAIVGHLSLDEEASGVLLELLGSARKREDERAETWE